MRRLMAVALFVCMLVPMGWSFDRDLAAKHRAFLSHYTRENLAKGGCMVTPLRVFAWIKDGEPVVFLDVRTKAEQAMVGITYKNTLHIPLNELFKEENLKKLPKDKKIVVVCYGGVRAAVATAMLREIGFKNAYLLKGGLKNLVKYTTVKTVP